MGRPEWVGPNVNISSLTAPAAAGHTVEYSDRGGGTLTTSAIVEFTVETRTLKKDGKLKSVRVLRVLEFTHE